MSVISIDNMYDEMSRTMNNNFEGTPEERFVQAKSLFLECVSESIDDNKKDLLKEV